MVPLNHPDGSLNYCKARKRPCSEPALLEFRSLVVLWATFALLVMTTTGQLRASLDVVSLLKETTPTAQKGITTTTTTTTTPTYLRAAELSETSSGNGNQTKLKPQRTPDNTTVMTSQRPNTTNTMLNDAQLLQNNTMLNDAQLLQNVQDWVRVQGGFINRKVEIQTISNALTGMVATEDMERNETICNIPTKLITYLPLKKGRSARCEQVNALQRILSKPELNPYEHYLKTRTAQYHHHMPWLWSEPGKQVLKEVLGNVWFSRRFEQRLDHVRKLCWPHRTLDDLMTTNDTHDQILLNALAIYHVRYESDHTHFVPFHDIINHGDGRAANAMGVVTTEGYELHTTRTVKAGEQLAMSYDEGNAFDKYTTERLFHEYAFVESYPQRFHLLAPINVKVSVYESGNVRVYDVDDDGYDDYEDTTNKNLLNLSEQKILDIQKELHRLEQFAETYGVGERMSQVPENEESMLWQFHGAAKNAVERILAQQQLSKKQES